MNPVIAKDVFPKKEKTIHSKEEDSIDAKEAFVAWLDTYRKDRKTSGSLLKNFKDIQARAEALAAEKESALSERLARYREDAET